MCDYHLDTGKKGVTSALSWAMSHKGSLLGHLIPEGWYLVSHRFRFTQLDLAKTISGIWFSL